MSGSIASRYIGGVPYGPGRSVGFYPNRASVGTDPGVTSVPGVSDVAASEANDEAVAAQQVQAANAVQSSGIGGGGGGSGDNMLASLLLGLLGAAPDAYRAVRDLLADEPAQQSQQYGPGENVFEPGSTFTGPGGVQIPNAALGGIGSDWNQVFEPGWSVDQAATQALLDAPMPAGDQFAGAAGDVGIAGAEGSGALAGGSWNPLAGQGYDFGLTGTMGNVPGFGDVATGLADLGGGIAGYYGSQGVVNERNPNSGYGHQIGSTIGGILGSFIPVPFVGTAVGAMMGGALGGMAGDQIGAPPTIGRNFSSIGTFNGDGSIGWGNAGGDNGGEASDATGFANWLSGDLMQQAQAQGLQFNPNMSGAQFRVGGYDNFNRNFDTPGGYFYTPDTGGSPENYALRPDSSWDSDPFSGAQANAFSQNVLADLTARGVFTQAGAEQPGLDFYGSSQGAPLGWYGGGAGQGSYGSDGNPLAGGFGAILGDRQGAVQGYVNQQQAQGATNAAAQQVLGDQFDPFNSYDPNFGWQQMAANGQQGMQFATPVDGGA